MNNTHLPLPLVTIITPVYNSVTFIEDCIISVLNQTYPNIEYIIMDGGSTDGTQAVAQKYADKLTLISEKDGGQSNAINKGWTLGKGEIVAWLNADDIYLPDAVEKAVIHLQNHPDTGWVYGCAKFVDEQGQAGNYRYPIFEWSYEKLLQFGCYIVQPTVFLRRQVLDEFGMIDESLHYGMDYDYWLRIGKKFPPTFVPEIRVIVKIFQETKSRSGGYKRLKEIEGMLARYGANDLPTTMHHQWVEAMLDNMVIHIRKGQWKALRDDFKGLRRYPAYVLRGIAKWILKNTMPLAVEKRLRRWFVRPAKSHPDAVC
ncbi:MAG: glycosyltransferase family 2 protein [bacterium]|nr:glycosyltransferase family 2 protein [bacterium]